PGPGLLYCENNSGVNPKNTPLPSNNNTNGVPLSGSIPPTYYFRTHFAFTGDVSGLTFDFTNYIDDGAVFYLNGKEIQRVRMAPNPIYTSFTDPPGSGACGGNEATCPDIFSVSPTNLMSGDNVLAVELHQAAPSTSDAVFGSALAYSRPTVPRPTLNFIRE